MLLSKPTNTQSSKRKCIISGTFITLVTIIAIIIIVMVIALNRDTSDSSTINWSQRYLELPSNETAKNNSYHLTRSPHLAATDQNNEYAVYLKNKLEKYGFDVELQQYENIYLSQYVESKLIQVNPSDPTQIIRAFNLNESIIDADPTSNTPLRSHAYFAYAATNIVTGPLVYVNYGSRKDFLNLAQNGYNLTGTIGIVKTGGGIFRGIKVNQAQEFLLKGLIIYTDPADYGSSLGPVFPHGPWMPSTGYERGVILGSHYCPGNPSHERVQEICGSNFDEFMPSIPVIPTGYQNAWILMSQMNGDSVDKSWDGGMNFTYKIGGYMNDVNDEIHVTLQVENDNNSTFTITNVIGKIEGRKYLNESILIGNHFDAWIYGASDPISGTAVSLEIARSIDEMINDGWEPKRNIYIAFWDAEEYGMIGSCEYAENNVEWLQNEVIAYLNVDVAVGGSIIYGQSDPMMSKFVIDELKKVNMPYDNDISLYEQWVQWQPSNRSLQTILFGHGSDYVPFSQHLGIPAISTGFTGSSGTYHSVYDSFTWINDIIDPQFQYHRVLAQYFGLMAIELISSDTLPYNVSNLYVAMSEWIDNEINQLIVDNNCHNSAGLVLQNMTYLIKQEIENFGESASYLESKISALIATNEYDKNYEYEKNVIKYNDLLQGLYQQFLLKDGLPKRPYFKSILMAPNLDKGFECQVFPYLAFALKYTHCNETKLIEAYTITSDTIKNASIYLDLSSDN